MFVWIILKSMFSTCRLYRDRQKSANRFDARLLRQKAKELYMHYVYYIDMVTHGIIYYIDKGTHGTAFDEPVGSSGRRTFVTCR